MFHIDRIQFAISLSQNKRVLDIGGQKMENCDPDSPFAAIYAQIEKAAAEYRIMDCQTKPDVDYVLDLNTQEAIPQLDRVLDDYQPEVVLCMETLEHVNYHFEVLNALARAVQKHRASVFITVPNNGNWLFNALGWNADHSVAFFADIAYRFVTRSDLGRHRVLAAPCMQHYLWYWRIAHALAFFQPMNLGFLILPAGTQPEPGLARIIARMDEYTKKQYGNKTGTEPRHQAQPHPASRKTP